MFALGVCRRSFLQRFIFLKKKASVFTVLFCFVLWGIKNFVMPRNGAEGITEKSGPQIDQSDCRIRPCHIINVDIKLKVNQTSTDILLLTSFQLLQTLAHIKISDGVRKLKIFETSSGGSLN